MIFRVLVAVLLLGPALAAEVRGGEMEEQLMEADRRFCADVQEGGAEAWALWFAEDGVQFPTEGRVEGRAEILALMEESFVPGAPALRWEPTEVAVAASGELGWTVGRWRLVREEEVLRRGNYVTLWKRDAEGRWKVAVDIGNRDPEE
jgi:ketosteroid isomerase-like protein